MMPQGSTINPITLANLEKINRECPFCHEIFETTVGGPYVCPECKRILRKNQKKFKGGKTGKIRRGYGFNPGDAT